MRQDATVVANLNDARRALAKLLPALPEPRLSEWMKVRGVMLPEHALFIPPNVPPIPDSPRALLEGLGPYVVASLPKA